MKQFAKRHLALLLAAVMVLTMLPVPARAEECTHENWGHKQTSSTGYFVIDDTYHGQTFYFSRVCVDCGAVIMDVDPSQTYTKKDYHDIFYLDNFCLVCNYRPGSTHIHDYKTSSTETKVEQVDSTYHNVVTTTYTKCSCGAEGESTVTTVQEAHTAQSYSYDTGHPHQKYGTCTCGAKIPVEGQFQTANGVQQDAAVCCVCHGHQFGAATEAAPGSWQKICANCGTTQAVSAPSQPGTGTGETNPPETNPPETTPPETTPPETNPPETTPPETTPPETSPPETTPPETSPPETEPGELPTLPHTHQFYYGSASPEHPHYAYGSCSCGEGSTILEYHFNCCVCTGNHKWGYPILLPDFSFRQNCTKCDASQTTTPSEGVKTYYKLIDMIKYRRSTAARYQKEHEIDSAASAIWKTIAEQAADKLTEGRFVGVNETLNSFSDMTGSISGVFTEETWDEQQIEIWKSLLIKMLQNRGDGEQALENLEILENVGDGFEYYGDVFSTILDWFEDSSAEDAKQMKENIHSLETSLGTMGEKIKEYKDAAQLAEAAGDTTHQFTNAVAKLEELSDQYQKDLEEINRNDWTKDSKLLGYAFDVFSIGFNGVLNAGASAEYAGILADLKACTENVAILEDICETAKATGNTNLEAAASQLKEEIQTEAVHKLNTMVAGITGFVDGILKEGAVMIVEGAGEKALKALGVSTKALEIIEMGAKLTKFFVDWDASYQAAQKLMTINQMDAAMNILDALKEGDDPYMAELWGLLQAEGCAQAQEFLTAWEDGTGLSSEDLGIDDGGLFGESELPDVINELDAERNYYIAALRLPLEKSR